MRRFVIALAVWPCFAAAQTAQEDADKGFIVDFLEENLSGDERQVSITGFRGALSSTAQLDQLTVADSEGVWLVVSGVTLDWNRRAVLRGALEVDTLSAEGISVLRPPVAAPGDGLPAAEAAPFSLPDLPVSIALDQLSITRLELGEAFLGEPLTLQINGAAALAGGQGTFDLDLTRLDEIAGRFALAGAFENVERRLTIDALLEEGSGGLVSRQLGLPGEPAVALTLTADAPLDDFAADLTITTDGVERIAGDFSLAQTEAEQRFALDIRGDVTTLFAPDYRAFFGPEVALTAQGAIPPEGGVTLSALDLTARTLTLTGQAEVGADGFPTSFDLQGRLADAGGEIVLLPLSGPKTFVTSADLDVQFDAAQSDGWTADITVDGYDRPGLFIDALNLQGGGTINAETGDVTADLAYGTEGLTFDNPDLTSAVGGDLTGQLRLRAASGAPTQIEELSLNSPGLGLQAQATIETDPTLKIDATALVAAEDFDRFAGISGIALAGSGDVSLIVEAEPLNGLYDLLLSGTTQDLQTGIAQLDPLILGAGTISAQAVRDADGTRLEGLRIRTPETNLQATAALTNSGGTADFDLSLVDIAKAEPRLSGPVRLQGTADLRPDRALEFDLDLTAEADSVYLGGTSTPTPDGRTLIADVTFDIDEAARFAALAGRDISGSLDGQGNLVLLADQTRFSTELALNTTDLQTDTPQVDPLLAGPGEWQIRAARTGETRYRLTELTGRTPWLEIAGSGSGDILAALEANLDILLPVAARIAPDLPGALRLNAAVDRSDDLVADVVATVTGEGTTLRFDGTIDAPENGYRATGEIDADIASLRPFSTLAGRSLAGAITASGRGSVLPDLSEAEVTLTAQSRNLAVGVEQADQLLRGTGQYDLTLTRQDEALRVPNFSVTTPAIDLRGSLTAQGSSGVADFTARLADIGLFTDQLSGPVRASGQAARQDALWRIDVGAEGPGGLSANIDGTVSDDLQLSLDASGAVPLGLANDILDPRRIDGTARYALSMNGPAALSSLSGNIQTTGARIAAPNLGQALEDLDATVRIGGGTATVTARGNVLSGGALSIEGPIALASPFDANLVARVNSLELRDPELYQTKISGALSMIGPLANGARITGDLDVFNTELRVPSSGIGALGSLPDVEHIGAPASVRQTLARAGATVTTTEAASPEQSGPNYPIDIRVSAPNRLFIRGRGLDAELGGQLTLGGTANAIVPNGQFNLIRGRLDILQQRFDLSEGSAVLQGDFVPYIRLVADTEANTGTRIDVIVEGPASAPEVRFESVPELPQDEILSQLIFGRNLSDISPLQAVQLASAIGTLAGRGGGGIIDGFRRDLNLDDFDLTTDESGNAAVRAGAYVSENVYTDVTVSSDGSTEINLNLDITNEITARGSVDNDGETSVGIFFQRDY